MSEAKQVDSKNPQLDAGAVVRLVMATCSASDEGLIRAALDNASVTSITAVADAFGVAESTVRNTWRRDPTMPGTAKRGTGQRSRYVLADICLWALKRAAAARAGRALSNSNGHSRTDAEREELSGIELASARAALQIRQARVAELSGDVLSAATARSEWNAGLRVLSEGVLSLPRKFKPQLPAKIADQFSAEFERFLRLELQAMSETSVDKIKSRMNGNGKH